jgi:outer membrane protein OmpA-like peptidoglycan-associated protein
LLYSLFFLHSSFAEDNPWYEPFFIETSAVHYFLPELFSGLMKPQPGFRGAAGYEFRNFRFAFESGYTHIEGTNPLVLDITLVPLTAKFGYSRQIYRGMGVQADISFGFFFSRTRHYQSALDVIFDKKLDEQAVSALAGARLYLTYTLPFRWLKLYAGAGADLILETEGPIPPPVIEAGISFKPLSLLKPKIQQRKHEPIKTETVEIKPEEPQAIEAPPQAQRPEKIILSSASVYFIADSTALIEDYRPLLDWAGQLLYAKPELRITLRGYTALSGTEDAMSALSAARSWYCAEYLMRCYGIAEHRMSIEFYGADKTPGQPELKRRVDLIIEQGAE